MPPDAFDVVVIDEFHHAEAPTYRSLLERLRPAELLGLTATPERGDGTDVRLFFDGRTAAELRVWDAIGAGLLSPFHYFGIGDNTDLTRVRWTRGRYDDGELSRIYTGNQARAALVIEQLKAKIVAPHRMRALGFCVSVDHASYMADVFRKVGIPALAVSGRTSTRDREAAVAQLRSGEVAALFAADLFNEGVDIPEVDTLLFLRPTESPTLFLQQLGRGLRLAPDKDVVTVLDFVGTNRQEFRLDLRFRALTGATRRGLERQVERGFPLLPSGSQIVLDDVTRDAVLANVRHFTRLRWQQLAAELRRHPTDSLAEFLEQSGAELAQIITKSKSWTQLRLDADAIRAQVSESEHTLLRRARAVAHVDDRGRAEAYLRILDDPGAAGDDVFARMLFYSLWPDGGRFESPAHGLSALADLDFARDDLKAVIELGFDSSRQHTLADSAGLPLAVHASYQREEILAALGHATQERVPSHFREGVLHTQVGGRPVDALFITLRKSEADYSPTTMYRDYPISATSFHWESQSTTSVGSPTGQRYLRGGSAVLLFVRRERANDLGTAPYVYLGPASYVSHTGDRPIAITWRLAHPMPATLYSDTAMAAI